MNGILYLLLINNPLLINDLNWLLVNCSQFYTINNIGVSTTGVTEYKNNITNSEQEISYKNINFPPLPKNKNNRDISNSIVREPNLKNNSNEIIQCAIEASHKYKLPTSILLGVSSQEGGRPGIRVRNNNGTYDIGLMQFNTSYLRLLNKFNITEEDVNQQNCYPYELAAWRIKKHILYDGGDTWTNVANYHSKTPVFNTRYQKQLIHKILLWDDYLNKTNTKHVYLSPRERASLNIKISTIGNARNKNTNSPMVTQKSVTNQSRSSQIYLGNRSDMSNKKTNNRLQNRESNSAQDGFSSKIDVSRLYL